MDILKLLADHGWPVTGQNEEHGTIKISCPHPEHEDSEPSCILNYVDSPDGKWRAGQWKCHARGHRGDLPALIAGVTGCSPQAAAVQYLTKSRIVPVKKILAWSKAIREIGVKKESVLGRFKQALYDRMITDDTIAGYLIGYDPGDAITPAALTIPVQWGDNYVNIRRYRPGDHKRKFANYKKGYGNAPMLYPQVQLQFKKIVVCAGEIKALAAAQYLNQYGVGAVSATMGEGNWDKTLNPFFEGKIVYVCYDMDEIGNQGAVNVCGNLNKPAKEVRLVRLNEHLDIKRFPHGDLNDYFAMGYTGEEFLKLAEDAGAWAAGDSVAPHLNAPYVHIPFPRLFDHDQNENFTTDAFIVGHADAAVGVPKTLHVKCSRDYPGCVVCKLAKQSDFDNAGTDIPIDPTHPLIAHLTLEGNQSTNVKNALGVPDSCKSFRTTSSEKQWTITPGAISADIDQGDDEDGVQSTKNLSAWIVSGNSEKYADIQECQPCQMKGRLYWLGLPAKVVRIISEHEPTDFLQNFKDLDVEALEVFRPREPGFESLEAKLEDIAIDQETHLTGILQRRDLHLIYDLVFHSPLYFNFRGSRENGWASALICGETSTGKSTIFKQLSEHYKHGKHVQGMATSEAGLIGGVIQPDKQHMIRWGALPHNDRRLLAIEEFAAASVDLIKSTRAIRTEGKVKITKVQQGEARARVRTMVLTNPKTATTFAYTPMGIDAIESVVPAKEDQRRFDIVCWLCEKNLEEDKGVYLPENEPKYSSEASAQLVRLAWSIPSDAIVFDAKARMRCLDSDLGREFLHFAPVCHKDFPIKLARLSASLAIRTFNYTDGKILVTEAHVKYVEQLLRRIYAHETFGYMKRLNWEMTLDETCTEASLYPFMRMATSGKNLVEFLIRYPEFQERNLLAAIGCADNLETQGSIRNHLIMSGAIQAIGEGNKLATTDRFRRISQGLRERMDAYVSTRNEVQM